MSRVSIIGAYNTKFGAFVGKEPGYRRASPIPKSYYEFLIEGGPGGS